MPAAQHMASVKATTSSQQEMELPQLVLVPDYFHHHHPWLYTRRERPTADNLLLPRSQAHWPISSSATKQQYAACQGYMRVCAKWSWITTEEKSSRSRQQREKDMRGLKTNPSIIDPFKTGCTWSRVSMCKCWYRCTISVFESHSPSFHLPSKLHKRSTSSERPFRLSSVSIS